MTTQPIFPPEYFCAQQVIPNLFIGPIESAENLQWQREAGITHVLTVCTQRAWLSVPDHLEFLHLPALDYGPMDEQYFDEAFDFIDNGRQKGSVLVNCFQGINRSAAVVIAYLMYKRDMELDAALALVKKARDVNPTKELVQCIEEYFANL